MYSRKAFIGFPNSKSSKQFVLETYVEIRGQQLGASLNIVFKLIKLHLAAGVPGGRLEQLNDVTGDKKIKGFQAEKRVSCIFPDSTDLKWSVALSSWAH